MFKAIERNYRKSLDERRFFIAYWTFAVAVVAIFIVAQIVFKNNLYPLAILLIIPLLIHFLRGYFKAQKIIRKRQAEAKAAKPNLRSDLNPSPKPNLKPTPKSKLAIYLDYMDEQRLNSLVSTLNQYNFKTKDDIRLAINYFTANHPIKTNSDLWGIIISTLLAFASLIALAYDDSTSTFNFSKVFLLLESSAAAIFIASVIAWLAYFILSTLIYPRGKLYPSLADDLANIYVNFDKYAPELQK